MPMLKKILYFAGFGLGVWMVSRKPAAKKSGFGVVFKNPVPGSIVTSGWGDSRSYRNGTHYGLDFRAPKGTPIYAAIGGTVTRIVRENSTTAGKHVIVKTDLPFGTINTRYLHMDKVRDDLKKGQKVKIGEQLGVVGQTYGPTSAGTSAAHLHFDWGGEQGVIEKYIELYGKPDGGFPEIRTFGTQFPCEPFIDADYTDTVAKRAALRKVPMIGQAQA